MVEHMRKYIPPTPLLLCRCHMCGRSCWQAEKLCDVYTNAAHRTGPRPHVTGAWVLRLAAGYDADAGGARISIPRRCIYCNIALCTVAGYLPQDPELDGSLTVLDAVLQSDSDAAIALRGYHHALAAGAEQGLGSAAQRAAIDTATAAVDALGAWSLDTDARSSPCIRHRMHTHC